MPGLRAHMIARSLKRCARLLAAGWNRVRGRRGSIAFGQLSDATCTDLILKIAQDGFCIVDEAGRILEVNDAWCRMLGYTRAALLASPLRDIEAAETTVEPAAAPEVVESAAKSCK